jgi:hypothetical protein
MVEGKSFKNHLQKDVIRELIKVLNISPFCVTGLNPEFAVAIYYGLQILAATLVSQFFSSPYLLICLRQKIAPTTRFASV